MDRKEGSTREGKRREMVKEKEVIKREEKRR